MRFGEEEPIKKIYDSVNNVTTSLIDDHKLSYFVMPRKKNQVWDKCKPSSPSHPNEIYADYREFTVLDDQVRALLDYRGNWSLDSEPWREKKLQFSWVGADVSIIPNYALNPEVYDYGADPDNKLSWRSLTDLLEDNDKILEQYEERTGMMKELKLDRDTFENYKGYAVLNRLILSVSNVGNRVSKLTRYTGDKVKLYNMIRSYMKVNKGKSTSNFIPHTFEIDVDDIEERVKEIMKANKEKENKRTQYFDDVLKQIIKENMNSEDSYWVVKPTHGSRGIGMNFTNKKTVIDNMLKWVTSGYEMGGKVVHYKKWMISAFKESFLWKLKTGNNVRQSLQICDYRGTNSKGKPINPNRPIKPPQFKDVKTGTHGSCKVIAKYGKDGKTEKGSRCPETGYEYLDMVNPSKLEDTGKAGITNKRKLESEKFEHFRTYKFNDSTGRINKARIWFVVDLSDQKYNIYVYRKLLFELCSLEFEGDDKYSNKMKVWTDSNEKMYGEEGIMQLDNVNASRCSELDLCYTVDWEDGKYNYLGKEKSITGVNWEAVKKNFKSFFETFRNATKDQIQCLSAATSLTDENFNNFGCFQYFGMDFIIDSSSNIWLLEMNTRPWSGYGNWWSNNFDPKNHHIPHKWVFIETLLRKVIDPKFKSKPIKLPYGEIIGETEWWINAGLEPETLLPLDRPVAIMSQLIPQKGEVNWIMNRQIKRVLLARGWGTFPYSHLVKNPNLIMQGMTPLLNHLTSVKKLSESEFQKHINKVYPDLVRARVVNRIFPLVVYLGNKSLLLDVMRDAYPTDKSVFHKNMGGNEYLTWDQILPYSFSIDKKEKNWEETIINESNKRNIKWIVKPALGKQGEGLKIVESGDRAKQMIDWIRTAKISGDGTVWVISHYIEPKLINDRKSHIRVFVLVHKDNKNKCSVYLMDPHLIFYAGLPYEKDTANEFISKYFKNKNIRYEDVKKFASLTNLAKGAEMFNDFVVDYEKIPKKGDINEIEKKMKKRTTWYKGAGSNEHNPEMGYSLLSDRADRSYGSNYNSEIGEQVKQIVRQTIYAIKDNINCVNENSDNFGGCYQYVAFDLMMDDRKPVPQLWVLEVNVNPGLKAPKNHLDGGISQLMNNIFDYVLDDYSAMKKCKIKDDNNVYKEDTKILVQDGGGSIIRKYKDDEGVEHVTKWKYVEVKKGDFKTYRYTKNKGGVLFDDNGDVKRSNGKIFTTGDSWVKGKRLQGGRDQEYYVPRKYRNLPCVKENTKKFVKVPDKIFTEILTMSISPQEKSFGKVKDQLFNSVLIGQMSGIRKEDLTKAGIKYEILSDGTLKILEKTYKPSSTVAKQLEGGGKISGTEPETWWSRLGKLFNNPYHERLLNQTAGQALPAAINLRFTYPFGRPGFRYYTDRHWNRIPNPGRFLKELAKFQKIQAISNAVGNPYHFIIGDDDEEETLTYVPAFGDSIVVPKSDENASKTPNIPMRTPIDKIVGITKSFGNEGLVLAELFNSGILDSRAYPSVSSDFSLGNVWGTMSNGLHLPPPLSSESLKKIKKLKADGKRGRNVPGLSCIEGTHDMVDRIIAMEGLDKANGISSNGWNKKQKCALVAAYGLTGYPLQMEVPWGDNYSIEGVPLINGLYRILEEADLVDTKLFKHTMDDIRLQNQLYGDQIKLYEALVNVTPRQVYSFPGIMDTVKRYY